MWMRPSCTNKRGPARKESLKIILAARNFPKALDLATYKCVKKTQESSFGKTKQNSVCEDKVCIYVAWMVQ